MGSVWWALLRDVGGALLPLSSRIISAPFPPSPSLDREQLELEGAV